MYRLLEAMSPARQQSPRMRGLIQGRFDPLLGGPGEFALILKVFGNGYWVSPNYTSTRCCYSLNILV